MQGPSKLMSRDIRQLIHGQVYFLPKYKILKKENSKSFRN